MDIKKTALSILCQLLKLKGSDIKQEMLDLGVIGQCIANVEKYPEDDVDPEILCLSLDLLA